MSDSFSSFKKILKLWLFPLIVAAIYGILYSYNPQSTTDAFQISCLILKQMALPICFVIFIMTLLNRVLSPALVTRFLGQKSGLRGVIMSSLAGVLSMGPLYAWYPLLKTLREQGASTFIMANFISCRAVKPVLFPVLLTYFGWDFSSIFVSISFAGALITAYIVSLVCPMKVKTGTVGS